MSSDVEDEASLDGEAAQFSHELVIQRDHNEPAEMTQQSMATTGETSLNLAQGENWLRLVVTLDRNTVLQDTQETSAGVCPYPSIVSLAEVGVIEAPTDDCFICIDVDGPYAAIKDMRIPITSFEEETLAVFEVCIARRKHPNRQGESDDEAPYDGQDSKLETDQKYHPLECLGRRQLKILHSGDHIVTRSNLSAGGDATGLILEYRQYMGAPFCTPHSRVDEEMAMEGSEIVNKTPTNTQDGARSIVVETQESDDENGEATQAFPRPSVLATQQSPTNQHMESNDETSMDEHEVDMQQTEDGRDQMDETTRAFQMPAIDSEPEEFTDKTSPRSQDNRENEENDDSGKGTTSAQLPKVGSKEEYKTLDEKETDTPMDQSTQAKEACEGTNDACDEKIVEPDISGVSMVDSMAVEGPKDIADVVVDVMEQPTQAVSMHVEESEVVDNTKEATRPSNKNFDVESRLEGGMDSESDALIDDDNASSALLDEDSPRKKKGDADTNENAVAMTAEPRTRKVIDLETHLESGVKEAEGVAIPMHDQRDKSVDSAQVNETMSDSSSITEVDEVTPEQRNETTSLRESHSQVPQKVVDIANSEADAKTEADVMAQLESSTKETDEGDKQQKSVETPSFDEVMSDSSSITEVDENIPGNLKNKSTSAEATTSHTPQMRVGVGGFEAVSALVGVGSHESSISEPADFSPRRGLVPVASEAEKGQEPSNQSTTAMMPSKTDAAVEDNGLSEPLEIDSPGSPTGTNHSPQISHDAAAISLPRSQEMKDASNASLNDSHGDCKGTTDEKEKDSEQEEAEPTSAVTARAPDSTSPPGAREVDEKDALVESKTPYQTHSGKESQHPGQNTPQRETKEDSQKTSTPASGDGKKRAREDYSLRGSCRKRSRTAAGDQSSEGDPIRVIITCVNVTAHHKKVCNANPIALCV